MIRINLPVIFRKLKKEGSCTMSTKHQTQVCELGSR